MEIWKSELNVPRVTAKSTPDVVDCMWEGTFFTLNRQNNLMKNIFCVAHKSLIMYFFLHFNASLTL